MIYDCISKFSLKRFYHPTSYALFTIKCYWIKRIEFDCSVVWFSMGRPGQAGSTKKCQHIFLVACVISTNSWSVWALNSFNFLWLYCKFNSFRFLCCSEGWKLCSILQYVAKKMIRLCRFEVGWKKNHFRDVGISYSFCLRKHWNQVLVAVQIPFRP